MIHCNDLSAPLFFSSGTWRWIDGTDLVNGNENQLWNVAPSLSDAEEGCAIAVVINTFISNSCFDEYASVCEAPLYAIGTEDVSSSDKEQNSRIEWCFML